MCVRDTILLFQWSYGITCWEIFSLGRIPYPGVDNANVITLLKGGKRLDQPELCPSKVLVTNMHSVHNSSTYVQYVYVCRAIANRITKYIIIHNIY